MLEAGATKGRDVRLEVRRIRSGASRYRLGDVVWSDYVALHRHLVVDVTVTSARTNTNIPRIGARLSAWVMLTLVLCALTVMSVCKISFVELPMFLFGVLGAVCGEFSCNVFVLLFMVLLVPISAMLCRRGVLMLWHALMFLGLRFFPSSSFCLVAYAAFLVRR
jgi:hypothetical protein